MKFEKHIPAVLLILPFVLASCSGSSGGAPGVPNLANTSQSQAKMAVTVTRQETTTQSAGKRTAENIPAQTKSVEIDAYAGSLPLPAAGRPFYAPNGTAPATVTCADFPANQTSLTISAQVPIGPATIVISAYSGACANNASTGELLTQAAGTGTATAAGGSIGTAFFGLTTAGPVSLAPAVASVPGFGGGGGSGRSGNLDSVIKTGTVNPICYNRAKATDTYTEIGSGGDIVDGNFVPQKGADGNLIRVWTTDHFDVDNSTPEPDPTYSPGTRFEPFNIYSGVLSLSNGQKSCIVIFEITHKSTSTPEPLPSGYPTFGPGLPPYAVINGIFPPDGYKNVEAPTYGKLTSFDISGIGSRSGSGSVTLDNGVTGNIQITDLATYDHAIPVESTSPQALRKRVQSLIMRSR